MSDRSDPLCIQCGQRSGDPTRFNRLPDGRPCPACAERLLAILPPLLPGYDTSNEPEPLEAEFDLGEADSEFDSDYDRPA